MKAMTERFGPVKADEPAPGLEGELHEAAARLKLQRVYGEPWPVDYDQLAGSVLQAALQGEVEFSTHLHFGFNEGPDQDCRSDCRTEVEKYVRQRAEELKGLIDRAVDEAVKGLRA